MRQVKLGHKVNDSGELVFNIESDKKVPFNISEKSLKQLNLQRFIIRKGARYKFSDVNEIPKFK